MMALRFIRHVPSFRGRRTISSNKLFNLYRSGSTTTWLVSFFGSSLPHGDLPIDNLCCQRHCLDDHGHTHILHHQQRRGYHHTYLQQQQQQQQEEETSQTRRTHQIRNKYLHIGPSGDSWISYSIFAAKHLQPDYVKSLPLFFQEDDKPKDSTNSNGKYHDLLLEIFEQEELLIEILEEDVELSLKLYDTGCFSMDVVQELHQRIIDEAVAP